MSALDRELLVLRGLTSCRGDEEKVAEAVAELAALRAELEQCRVDAERYQLVRRGQHWSVIDGIGNALRADELDAAIGAARGAK